MVIHDLEFGTHYRKHPYIVPVWWFGTWIWFFHSVGNFIIPTDELHHFSEGWRKTTNQVLYFIYFKGCSGFWWCPSLVTGPRWTQIPRAVVSSPRELGPKITTRSQHLLGLPNSYRSSRSAKLQRDSQLPKGGSWCGFFHGTKRRDRMDTLRCERWLASTASQRKTARRLGRVHPSCLFLRRHSWIHREWHNVSLSTETGPKNTLNLHKLTGSRCFSCSSSGRTWELVVSSVSHWNFGRPPEWTLFSENLLGRIQLDDSMMILSA